jgi:hypothetical protein
MSALAAVPIDNSTVDGYAILLEVSKSFANVGE